MYQLSDTIVAVSSPTADKGVIVRVSGPETTEKINQFFSPKLRAGQKGIVHGILCAGEGLEIEATVYLFAAGHSYTGESLAEIHFWSNPALTEAVVEMLLAMGVRAAGTGEFTARAYLNGRMDLAQAEAVNKVITCSNRLQLGAAEKLLGGRLTQITAEAAEEILDCLSRIEAGMDFSEENVEFIGRDEASKIIEGAGVKLERLLSGSISFEAVTDLPSVGIAGAVNAGKSSLLNKLLGRQRSIVSPEGKTTRDVLTGIVEREHSRSVLFDCAGLIAEPHSEIDLLAQRAAIEALNKADVVLFCVDVTKEDISEDVCVRTLIESATIIPVATKADLLDKTELKKRTERLAEAFGMEFLPTSSISGEGLRRFCDVIEHKIAGEADARAAGVALTARHKQSVGEAVENLNQAIIELKKDNDEVAAMLMRAAYQSLSNLEREHIDEKILDNIFSQFCIGK